MRCARENGQIFFCLLLVPITCIIPFVLYIMMAVFGQWMTLSHCNYIFLSADCRKEGRPSASPAKENIRKKLKKSGGAAAEGAGALPANTAPAVPTGHTHSPRLLPALSPLCEYTRHYSNLCTQVVAFGATLSVSLWLNGMYTTSCCLTCLQLTICQQPLHHIVKTRHLNFVANFVTVWWSVEAFCTCTSAFLADSVMLTQESLCQQPPLDCTNCEAHYCPK